MGGGGLGALTPPPKLNLPPIAESPDAKDTRSWLSSAHRRRGITYPEIMLLSGVV